MGSTELRTQNSIVLNTAVAAADVGDTAAHSDILVSVGGAGEPSQIWITSMYGVASTAGTIILFESDDPDVTARAVTNIVAVLYQSTTGDGVTGVCYGPITHNLYATSDATFINAVSRFEVTYDYV